MNFLDLIWLIPLFPGSGFVINGLFGKRMPKTAVGVIAAGAVLISFIFAAGAVYQLAATAPNTSAPTSSKLYEWINAGSAVTTSGEETRFVGGLGLPAGSAVFGDGSGRHRNRFPDPRLLHRIHVGGGRVLPILRLPEPLHVLDADAGSREQLPDDVHRVGRRRSVFVSADRILLPQEERGRRGEEGIRREPSRRLGTCRSASC